MSSVFEFLGGLGAGLIRAVLGFAWLLGAAWAGITVAEKTDSNWKGWIVGIVSALLLGVLVFPAYDALRKVECKGADNFQDCVDGEGDYDPSY